MAWGTHVASVAAALGRFNRTREEGSMRSHDVAKIESQRVAHFRVSLNGRFFQDYWANVYIDATAASDFRRFEAYMDIEIYCRTTEQFQSPVGSGVSVEAAAEAVLDDLAAYVAKYDAESLPLGKGTVRTKIQRPLSLPGELSELLEKISEHLAEKSRQ